MSRVEFLASSPPKISDLEQDYLAECTAPLDGMWQSFADMADIFEIKIGQNIVGYAAINGDNELLRFHVSQEHDPGPILKLLITDKKLVGAVVSTAEPRALATITDVQKSVSNRAIMYHRPGNGCAADPEFPDDTTLKPARPDELEVIADFAHRTLGASLDWLLSYFDGLIGRAELYALWQGDVVLATGECRRNTRQPNVADVGMIVGKPYRRKRIATNMLKSLAQKAVEHNLSPICSTETDNVGAQKAIIGAGFISYHRILNARF